MQIANFILPYSILIARVAIEYGPNITPTPTLLRFHVPLRFEKPLHAISRRGELGVGQTAQLAEGPSLPATKPFALEPRRRQCNAHAK
ncbi:MAG: hypothetical protein ACUVX8_03890 [Candidatus Zipacnadales bacterium]